MDFCYWIPMKTLLGDLFGSPAMLIGPHLAMPMLMCFVTAMNNIWLSGLFYYGSYCNLLFYVYTIHTIV